MLTKLKSLIVLLFVCTFLVGTSLTSCENKGGPAGKENEDHPAGEAEKKSEHPAGEEEHPKSDTTKVEEQ